MILPESIFPKLTSTLDFLLGSNATSSAEFAVTGINDGTPTASVSATTGGGAGNGISLTGATATIQSLRMGTLTLGGSSTGNIVIDSGSNLLQLSDATINLTDSAFTSEDNSVLYTGVGGKLSAVTTTTSGQCLVSAAENNPPTWATCPGGSGGSNWTLNTTTGVLRPNNNTTDLILGGTATASAKFLFTNMISGNPKLNIFDSSSTNYLSLYHDGTNGYIESSSGDLILGNGAG